MSKMRFDRTMSDAEGLMWRLEDDPFLSSTFGTVTLLDQAPDFEAFRRRMRRAVMAVPRLRQRIASTPANLAPPRWVDDAHFDLDYHVRRLAAPKPGDLRQVLDLATLIVADPFDRTRPLWQFIVIEGLKGNKAAFVQKMHHTISDGERGIELSRQYLDFERDAPEPPPLTADESNLDSDINSEPASSTTDTVRAVINTGLRIPTEVARQVTELMADPAGLPDATSRAAKTLKGIVSTLSDTDPAKSPLWTQRSLKRKVETARAPLDATKDTAKRLGGTLNTAFVTAAAHAASQYHRELGAPVEQLRASMAVSTRTKQSGSNAFSIVRLLVPTGDMPIEDRFLAIEKSVQALRSGAGGAGIDQLAAVAASLPNSMIIKLARQQSQTIDFATSNVKGAPVPVFIAGAQFLEIYPIGPLAGVAFNLTLMSYLGSLDMAMNIDTAAVQEPELLIDCLNQALVAFTRV